jgi:hypothetical protein
MGSLRNSVRVGESPLPGASNAGQRAAVVNRERGPKTSLRGISSFHRLRVEAGGGNDPRNGLALCKNAHGLFDNGLWMLTDYYRVLVAAGPFAEGGPDGIPRRPAGV